jgi:hypothetical protein
MISEEIVTFVATTLKDCASPGFFTGIPVRVRV